ncbi:MAG: fibrinogen-related protein, partial [Candidatus Paceibacterota bacterium]
TLTTFDQFLGVGYWNDIGTQMKLEQGASPTSLSHKAIYTFSIDKNALYKLTLSNENIVLTATGTARPGLASYNQYYNFSTYDSDNDAYGGNCSTSYGAQAWWYGSCWDGSFWAYGTSDSPRWATTLESFSWGGMWIK